MSENHFATSHAQSDDLESMMEEARLVDCLLSGDQTLQPVSTALSSDPAILLILCRALEKEAQNKLDTFKREHLLTIHKCLAGLKEDIERRLVGCFEPSLAST
ncbi:hypothetical protein [Hyphomicrobium sp.]|jgi:hypothetical protein|uniref:hypothetical protein n=1 Tax=Hyphomicrobium sp. TaxID=82 RepID=UPI00356ADE6A